MITAFVILYVIGMIGAGLGWLLLICLGNGCRTGEAAYAILTTIFWPYLPIRLAIFVIRAITGW